jgi:AcrR family transcriptional regulator
MPSTRTRLLETALQLFGERGVEGTSLQMIADEFGVTKAAVYYHFKTKEEIVAAVVAPLRTELDPIVEDALTQRSWGAQVDRALAGFVDLIVRHRTLVSLITSDPGIARVLRTNAGSPAFWSSQTRLTSIFTGPDPDAEALVRAHVVLRGLALAGATPELAHLDDETLRATLLESGRRLMGRPRARR